MKWNRTLQMNLEKYFKEVDDGVWVTVDRERERTCMH